MNFLAFLRLSIKKYHNYDVQAILSDKTEKTKIWDSKLNPGILYESNLYVKCIHLQAANHKCIFNNFFTY